MAIEKKSLAGKTATKTSAKSKLDTSKPLASKVVAANGYYTPPTIPWQYTLNAGVFYSFLEHYSAKFEIYNLTNRTNWQAAPPFYGNDFLVRNDPRTFEVRLQAKF